MAVALTALAVALGGTSYAAVTIGGSNVRNNSLTSADIRNNSLTNRDVKDNALGSGDIRNGSLLTRDFKASERAALRGATGPAGAAGTAGAAGATGPTGPRGPSTGFFIHVEDTLDLTATLAPVIALELPAGSFVVTANTVLNSNAPAGDSGECELFVGGTRVADSESLSLDGTTYDREAVSLTGAGTLGAPSTAELRCRLSSATGNATDQSMTAVQVDSVTTQTR
jgi:hypothetical protein